MKRPFLATLLVLGAACLGLAATEGQARANGRFPESNKILFSPGDPDTVILRVTFGLLLSHDHGKTWDWVCEQSVGYTGIEDPMYAIGPSGKMFASTFLGISASPDKACSWSFVKGELDSKLFVDLSQRPADPKSIVFFASSYEGQNDAGQSAFSSELFETTDEGASFKRLSGALDTQMLGETVDVAPSDPERLYVSGVKQQGTAPVGVMLASKDHGTSWSEVDVPLVATERSLYIAAVDPKNADRVYVRTSAAENEPTRVLVSDDGAKTFRVVKTGKGAILGFALSPDGSKIYLGGPLDELEVASTTDFQFTPRAANVSDRLDGGVQKPLRVQCLTATSEGLWACSNEASGFVAGFSADDGATFEPRLRFCDIRGPLACAEGTTTNVQCVLGGPDEPRRAPWPAQRASLGCGGSLDGGTSVDGGTSSGEAPGPGDGGGDGCSCRAAGRPSWAAFGGASGVFGVLALLRRRGRKKRR